MNLEQSAGRCVVCGGDMPMNKAAIWLMDGEKFGEAIAAGFVGIHMGCEGAYKRGERREDYPKDGEP